MTTATTPDNRDLFRFGLFGAGAFATVVDLMQAPFVLVMGMQCLVIPFFAPNVPSGIIVGLSLVPWLASLPVAWLCGPASTTSACLGRPFKDVLALRLSSVFGPLPMAFIASAVIAVVLALAGKPEDAVAGLMLTVLAVVLPVTTMFGSIPLLVISAMASSYAASKRARVVEPVLSCSPATA